MRSVFAMVLGFALLIGSLLARDDDKKDREKLVGTWKLVSMDNGKGARELDGFQMVISDKGIELHAPNGSTKKMGDITRVDRTAKPAQIDLKNGTMTGLGIYEIKGEDLKLIIRDPSQGRPTEFKGTPQGILFLLKREKP